MLTPWISGLGLRTSTGVTLIFGKVPEKPEISPCDLDLLGHVKRTVLLKCKSWFSDFFFLIVQTVRDGEEILKVFGLNSSKKPVRISTTLTSAASICVYLEMKELIVSVPKGQNQLLIDGILILRSFWYLIKTWLLITFIELSMLGIIWMRVSQCSLETETMHVWEIYYRSLLMQIRRLRSPTFYGCRQTGDSGKPVQWYSLSPKAWELTRSSHVQGQETTHPTQEEREFTLPLPFCSTGVLFGGLDNASPHWWGWIFFTRSTDSNANLLLKYPHRHTQK